MIKPEQLVEAQTWRYATKLFKRDTPIPAATWAALEQSLIYSPSSYGLQPWKFVVVTDPKVKQALRPHSWNQSQVEDCSHFVVFCALEKISADHVARFVDLMAQVQGVDRANLAGYEKMMLGDVVAGGRGSLEWATRQCYIALGNFMTSAALVGVDTCPIEGFKPAEYDKELGLAGTGWRSVVCCASGYRSAEDKYSRSPKVRFPTDALVDHR